MNPFRVGESLLFRDIELSGREYSLLAELVRERSGINLGDNKKELLKARLVKRLRARGFTSFRQYYECVSRGGGDGELGEMINAVSTNVTSFFRENRHFDYLGQKVIPELAARPSGARVRLWSAACSTGEEAYSMMMTVLESMDCSGRNVKLLANDISTRVLETARAGRYPSDKINSIPGCFADKYFSRPGGGLVEVNREVRSFIAFRHFNLLVSPLPFTGRFDVIFCRNLMIYFDPPTQKKLVHTLSGALNPGGHLFIGHSESIPFSKEAGLKGVAPAVFRRIQGNHP